LREWIRGNVWAIALAFLACVLLQSAFGFLAGYCSNSVAEYSAKNVRDRLYAHVQDLPYETLLRAQSGDWLQRCTVRRRHGAPLSLLRDDGNVPHHIPDLLRAAGDVQFSARGSRSGAASVMPLVFAFSLGFHKIVGRIFSRASTSARESSPGSSRKT
jgi:ATP-binding cassette subfamily B protein